MTLAFRELIQLNHLRKSSAALSPIPTHPEAIGHERMTERPRSKSQPVLAECLLARTAFRNLWPCLANTFVIYENHNAFSGGP
jgi:hypothetical protein